MFGISLRFVRLTALARRARWRQGFCRYGLSAVVFLTLTLWVGCNVANAQQWQDGGREYIGYTVTDNGGGSVIIGALRLELGSGSAVSARGSQSFGHLATGRQKYVWSGAQTYVASASTTLTNKALGVANTSGTYYGRAQSQAYDSAGDTNSYVSKSYDLGGSQTYTVNIGTVNNGDTVRIDATLYAYSSAGGYRGSGGANATGRGWVTYSGLTNN